MSEINKFFGGGELEAPSREAQELAQIRHYEALTRIDTLCEAGKAGIQAVVSVHRKIEEQDDLPPAVLHELYDLEIQTYRAAKSVIKHLGYE